jgi:hypothetical protein
MKVSKWCRCAVSTVEYYMKVSTVEYYMKVSKWCWCPLSTLEITRRDVLHEGRHSAP